MAQATLAEIKEIIANQLGNAEVNNNDRIVEDLGAESSDIANIVAAVEDRYGITINVDHLARLKTVQDVFNAIQSA